MIGDSVRGLPILLSITSVTTGTQLFSPEVIGECPESIHARIQGRQLRLIGTKISEALS